jgi:hypothetical protein
VQQVLVHAFLTKQRHRVILTQILRMVFSYDPKGGGVLSLEQLSIWTGLHLGFGIICACLPVFRVYLPKDDGLINTTLKRLYTTVTTHFYRFSRKYSSSGYSDPTLPSFVRPNRVEDVKLLSTDELPLTEFSVVSEVERLGGAEYHLR